MPTIPVPDTVAVHIRGSADGQFTENILFYEQSGGYTSSVLEALAEAIAPIIISDWVPLLSGDWVGREVYVKDLASGSSLQWTDGSIFGYTGSATGGALPNNATIAVARKTGLAGRSYMGRIFWQSLATSQQAAVNTLLATVGSDIIDAVVAVDNAAVALGWQPVVVSLYTGGVARAAGVTTPITAWLLTNLTLDSRRRRLPGRGM